MDYIEQAPIMEQRELFLLAESEFSEENDWIFDKTGGTFRTMYNDMLCVVRVTTEKLTDRAEVIEDFEGKKIPVEVECPCLSVSIQTVFQQKPSKFIEEVMEHVSSMLQEQFDHLITQAFRIQKRKKRKREWWEASMLGSLVFQSEVGGNVLTDAVIEYLEGGARILVGLLSLLQEHEQKCPKELAKRIVHWEPPKSISRSVGLTIV